MANPKCFISYSWDSEEHKKWVRNLATELQDNGVETSLDQWDTYPGIDLTKYMETCVRESDFVLLICTQIYAEKANAGKGGVGYEKTIITGEIFETIASPKKFVPILRSGTLQNSLPSFLKSKLFIDFRNDSKFTLNLDGLLRHIHQIPKTLKPPLGSKPSFREDTSPTSLVKDSFKKLSILEKFKEVYFFAHGSNGMNLDTDSAKDFSAKWLEQFEEKDFEKFKEVYFFAHGSNGMNLDTISAKKFALNWIEGFVNEDFARFKEIYIFAHGLAGMNLDIVNAMNFALNMITKEASENEESHKEQSKNKSIIPTLWYPPLPKINFKVSQRLLRILHFPQVGWEAFNDSPYQLSVRIEVHPFLGRKDLHPLPDNSINGDRVFSVYTVAPNSPVFTNGCFTLPQICATSNAELVLEIRSTAEDMNNSGKGEYKLIPSRWKYIRDSNTWSYHPQQIMPPE